MTHKKTDMFVLKLHNDMMTFYIIFSIKKASKNVFLLN